ncbi:SRPBCC family protein [Segniliparus rugosus]|uniref:Polyketide cyclase / dehydrase and lipid transport n=1 Tax=Segniliparus rugosus (strain ATCC BAA-974 / DSM 45345 / CCUG 50838 / CIP 108380 / JCM 13579 / CDC 945) TaxID=679197 RepID=E5XR95_SEGRC|nr:SRPBCC family protein [Segniliparus rugosus]EFV13136.1 hypothetical protein HMPREF9336_02017 [Segniliparus rugosus ATCC BAA-974]
MTTETWLWIAVGVVVAAALAGLGALAVLFALAHGERGPRRFRVDPVEGDPGAYLDEKATWAATAEVTVPIKPEQVWAALTEREHLRLPLIVTGPTWKGEEAVYRGAFAAWSERVARSEQARELTTIGVGVSAPLLIKSFGQRYLLRPGDKGTTVAWTIAITPKWVGFLPLRWTGFLARPVLKFALRDGLK